MEITIKFSSEEDARVVLDRLKNIEELMEILLERLDDEKNVRDGRGSEEGESAC
jgi:hypothetical protein